MNNEQKQAPSDIVLGLAEELHSLRKAQTVLVTMVEALGVEASEDGGITYDAVLAKYSQVLGKEVKLETQEVV